MQNDSLAAKIKRTAAKIRLLKNWYNFVLPETYFDYLQDITIKLRNGLVFHVHNSSFDLPIILQTFAYDIYGDISEFRNDKQISVLDIGGHIGIFSIWVAHKLPRARVTAFEPDPSNHALFDENVRTNQYNNRVTLVKRAVCGESGKRKLFVNPTNTSMNNLYVAKEIRGMRDTITVMCTTLTNIIQSNGSFALTKIDCEGAEYEIIFSAPNHVWKNLPYMIIEWHANTEHTPEELVAFLKSKGYKTTYSRKPRIITARL